MAGEDLDIVVQGEILDSVPATENFSVVGFLFEKDTEERTALYQDAASVKKGEGENSFAYLAARTLFMQDPTISEFRVIYQHLDESVTDALDAAEADEEASNYYGLVAATRISSEINSISSWILLNKKKQYRFSTEDKVEESSILSTMYELSFDYVGGYHYHQSGTSYSITSGSIAEGVCTFQISGSISQVEEVSVSSTLTGTIYELSINGITVSITSDSDAEESKILTSLSNAIIANSSVSSLVTPSIDGSILRLTANEAGTSFSVSVVSDTLLESSTITVAQGATHNFRDGDEVFFTGVLVDGESSDDFTSLKILTLVSDTEFSVETTESGTITASDNGIYAFARYSFIEAASFGIELSRTPGVWDLHDKTLTGLTPTPTSLLSFADKQNLKAKNVSYFIRVGTSNVLKGGDAFSGTPLSVYYGQHDLESAIVNSIWAWKQDRNVSATQKTIDAIEQLIRSVIESRRDTDIRPGFVVPLINSSVAYQVLSPSLSSLSSTDILNHILQGFQINVRGKTDFREIDIKLFTSLS